MKRDEIFAVNSFSLEISSLEPGVGHKVCSQNLVKKKKTKKKTELLLESGKFIVNVGVLFVEANCLFGKTVKCQVKNYNLSPDNESRTHARTHTVECL